MQTMTSIPTLLCSPRLSPSSIEVRANAAADLEIEHLGKASPGLLGKHRWFIIARMDATVAWLGTWRNALGGTATV